MVVTHLDTGKTALLSCKEVKHNYNNKHNYNDNNGIFLEITPCQNLSGTLRPYLLRIFLKIGTCMKINFSNEVLIILESLSIWNVCWCFHCEDG